MSFRKAILHGKEHRTEYGTTRQSFAKAVDKHCRNHGSCPWCLGNRRHRTKKREPIVLKEELYGRESLL